MADMHLGIDFGTTRTAVACADRGNHPVVTFSDGNGDPIPWIPTLLAERDGELDLSAPSVDHRTVPRE
jgi:molecular chaperone DnaK (HSP70)